MPCLCHACNKVLRKPLPEVLPEVFFATWSLLYNVAQAPAGHVLQETLSKFNICCVLLQKNKLCFSPGFQNCHDLTEKADFDRCVVHQSCTLRATVYTRLQFDS